MPFAGSRRLLVVIGAGSVDDAVDTLATVAEAVPINDEALRQAEADVRRLKARLAVREEDRRAIEQLADADSELVAEIANARRRYVAGELEPEKLPRELLDRARDARSER